MSPAGLAGAGFGLLLAMMALGLPIGLAMLLIGGLGYTVLVGPAAFLAYLSTTPYYTFSSYTLSVIPLFVLMGALAERGGLSGGLFAAMQALLGPRRGGVAIGTVGACTLFGAICGSSVATTAALGRVALPELRRLGYAPRLATGTVAAGGTLGILIPPSIVLVIYAITTEQNIATLFVAAIVPGLLAASSYACVIALWVRLAAADAPAVAAPGGLSLGRVLAQVWPVLVLTVVVVGGIWGGVFTPTESAAVGVVGALVLGAATGGLRWPGVAGALQDTAETTALIFMVLLGAEVFNAFLGLAQIPDLAAMWVAAADLPPRLVVVAMLAFYIVLGGVMDELAMILLTLPVFFPVVMGLNLGLAPAEVAIWFGILVLVIVGIGLIAPPIGLNVFVTGGLAQDVPLATIYRGVLPFVAADLVRLALLVAFPGLSLALVRLLT